MTLCGLVIALTWIGSARLQYINTGGPAADSILHPFNYPMPYTNSFNIPGNELEKYEDQMSNLNINQIEQKPQAVRKIHIPDADDNEKEEHWLPNLVDTDKTSYITNNDADLSPYIKKKIEEFAGIGDTKLDEKDKKSFSPWGGKRFVSHEQSNAWTWKRAANMREPSMPKRVRFSQWGGKRSSPMIYKPGPKSSKIIFSNTIPEFTRIISNYAPNGHKFNLAGLQFIPSPDKRNPIRILALTSKLDDSTIKETLPFGALIEAAKWYKPGHRFADVNFKKDGKRKVKFSAWGGKRSPPIIGPIWSASSQSVKDNNLDAILLIRNSQADNAVTTSA